MTIKTKGTGSMRFGRKYGVLIKFLISLVIAYIMFFPIFTVLFGGFKTSGQILNNPFGLPVPPSVGMYAQILGKASTYGLLLSNSILVAFLTIAIVIFSAMSVGVALSRIDFRGKSLIYNYFISGMLFPLTVAILPLYLQLRNFNLIDKRIGLIIAEAAFNLPFSIFIFTGFFREIPKELQDACSIDGGTIFTFFRKVIVPLSTPILSTVSIFVFVASWNQFLLPLLVLTKEFTYTLPLGIMQFQGQFEQDWGLIMAFITLSVLPVAIFYFALQRYIIAGLTSGAVKG